MLYKCKIVFMSICNSKIIIAPVAKKGPNGIMWSLFLFNIIKEIGRPIIDPTNIDSIAMG